MPCTILTLFYIILCVIVVYLKTPLFTGLEKAEFVYKFHNKLNNSMALCFERINKLL